MTDLFARMSPITRRSLLAGAAGTGVAGLLAACTSATGGSGTTGASSSAISSSAAPASGTASSSASAPSGSTPPATKASTNPSSTPTTPAPSISTRHAKPARKVSVMSVLGDGAEVGVGMPLTLLFDPSPTDAAAFVKATRVTVNGKPVAGAWHWSQPYAGEPMQAHYRLEQYWPANSTIKLELPIKGLSAGKGLEYAGALSSVQIRTGDKRVTIVNGATERAVVRVNGRKYRVMQASLGKSSTPTTTGIKLVMQKGEDIPGTNTLRPDGAVRMQNTAHTYDLMVDWSVRVTESGEYLHAAPWNSEIGQVSTSDGCTNLSVEDAKWYYNFSRIGDVVIHKNTGGSPIPLWDGYTDWNVAWATWQQGGLLKPT